MDLAVNLGEIVIWELQLKGLVNFITTDMIPTVSIYNACPYTHNKMIHGDLCNNVDIRKYLEIDSWATKSWQRL